ncbi:MAG: alkyl sulfatase dimerization domain-containing protein [Pseudomonadales bacterium]|jgi:alkyl sulfatase BDS1-like metallo-beta-lactamase superfamily hydrolase|nr:alkyl sulfatase dimerization domain-containing protein [Pseudomonadales bacterium]
MADLIGMSTKVIDEGDDGSVGPLNRINHELSVLADDIAMVEAFSHSVVFRTDAGLVAFDTSNVAGGRRVVDAIRSWSPAPFHSIVFTHGHVDHVGGSGAFAADAAARGEPLRCVGHENVPRRFDRYDLTNGYNLEINARQFGAFARRGYALGAGEEDSDPRFLPPDAVRPDLTYRDRLELDVGGLAIELRHARGETDDHSWAWIPEHRAICAGDFFIWNFPNAGNPQKVQRYPLEWARAMRDMAAMDAELFLPAHGLPIGGRNRIRRVLTEVSDTLEALVLDVIERMNAGQKLDAIVHEVHVAPELLERPWLRPMYDEPEFVVRNVWRLYGGWWDGNPAHLKPAPDARLGAELAALCGGAGALARRAQDLADAGDLRLACHLAEFAVLAAPEDAAAHAVRAHVYQKRRDAETSLMAKGIYGSTANASRERSAD